VFLDVEGSDQYSIQGAYNFVPVTAQDTGLVVVPGSHLVWQQRKSGQPTRKKDRTHFGVLRDKDEAYEQLYANAVKLLLPKGVFVLWNSKTLHGTSPGTRERPNDAQNQPQLNRLTAFVCLMPKALRSEEALARKREIYFAGTGSTHWATLGIRHKLMPQGCPRRLDGQRIPAERAALL
jgi:hypothetical protein